MPSRLTWSVSSGDEWSDEWSSQTALRQCLGGNTTLMWVNLAMNRNHTRDVSLGKPASYPAGCGIPTVLPYMLGGVAKAQEIRL